MNWDWYDIEKLSEDEKRTLRQEFDLAGNTNLPALPDMDEMTLQEARRELQKDKNIEAGKNVPAMNLQELEEEQRKKEQIKNVREQTKDLFPEDNVPSAPNSPKPPKESLASRAKRLAAKGKRIQDKAGTALGDAYARRMKVTPEDRKKGTPNLKRLAGQDRYPNLQRLTQNQTPRKIQVRTNPKMGSNTGVLPKKEQRPAPKKPPKRELSDNVKSQLQQSFVGRKPTRLPEGYDPKAGFRENQPKKPMTPATGNQPKKPLAPAARAKMEQQLENLKRNKPDKVALIAQYEQMLKE